MMKECHRCKYNNLSSDACLSCMCEQGRYDYSLMHSHVSLELELSSCPPDMDSLDEPVKEDKLVLDTDYDTTFKLLLAVSDMSDLQLAVFKRLIKGCKTKEISEQLSKAFGKPISPTRVGQLKNDIRAALTDISPAVAGLWYERIDG